MSILKQIESEKNLELLKQATKLYGEHKQIQNKDMEDYFIRVYVFESGHRLVLREMNDHTYTDLSELIDKVKLHELDEKDERAI
jgi:hypothetical protein